MSERNKVEIVKSQSRPGYFRVVINPSEDFSVGVIQDRAQLQALYYHIKDLLAATAHPAGDDELFVIVDDTGEG